MNCNEARRLFSLSIDGGLSFEEQSELDLHQEACRACAMELKRVRKAVEMVRELPDVPPAPTFVQDVLRAAREAERTPRKEPGLTFWERVRARVLSLDWEPTPRLAVAGATLLILGMVVGVGGGLLVFGGHHADSGTIEETATVVPAAETPAIAAASGSSSENPVAAGPFEDLVQQMIRRLDTASTTVGDTTGAPLLDWGSARVPGPAGQPVDASPSVRRDHQNGGQVYIDF